MDNSEQDLVTWMILFFLFILPLLVTLGVILAGWIQKRKTGERSDGLREIVLPIGLWDGFAIGLFAFLMCIFQLHWYMKLCIFLAAILLEGLLVGLMAGWFTWKRFLLWLPCALAVFGVLVGTTLWEEHLREISMPESFDYRDYLPFQEESPVARLEGESSLRFSEEDKLPRMDGATALYPVYAAFAQATYPEEMERWNRWDVEQQVYCGTTSSAYRNIVKGGCDIIFVAGPSKEQEAYAREQGVELVYTPIGREAFVFFVNPKNPIDGMTLEQIRGVYSGEITQWTELGVPGLGKILPFQRSEGSGSQTALERFVMGDTPLMPAKTEEIMTVMDGIVEQVSSYKNHRNAIGYSFRFYCTGLMRDFDVKLLEIEGVAPTVENIENGTYPLASYFYAVTRSDADENTLRLLDWILSPQGQELVEKSGYTPLA